MATTTVQGSIKRLLWNSYQQKQAPSQTFPHTAPPFSHFWEISQRAVPEMFHSKHVVFNTWGPRVSHCSTGFMQRSNQQTQRSPLSLFISFSFYS